MIPIHYFFILLTLLASLMGCTQKAPPGTRQVWMENNTTDFVDPSTPALQTIQNQKKKIIRPQDSRQPTTIEMTPVMGDRWTMTLQGDDAAMLYGLLEVPEVRPAMGSSPNQVVIKTGQQFSCTRLHEMIEGESRITYSCELVLFNLDGRIQDNGDEIRVAQGAATELSEPYRSAFLELDVPKTGKFGRLVFLGNLARKIYESSSVGEEALPDLGTAHHRSGKRGEHVSCVQEWIGEDLNPYYSCRFFFNYPSGSFDKIQ